MFTKFFELFGAYTAKEKAIVIVKIIGIAAASFVVIELVRAYLWYMDSLGVPM